MTVRIVTKKILNVLQRARMPAHIQTSLQILQYFPGNQVSDGGDVYQRPRRPRLACAVTTPGAVYRCNQSSYWKPVNEA
jgi:hypothetical protein